MAIPLFHAKHPKEMYLLATAEMCQRFAFWGIGNLLVLYLVEYHRFADHAATTLFGFFTGAAFVLPVFGGFVADRLGYRLPVLFGSIATAIGCLLIATGSVHFLYAALGCIAIGAAVFTPSIYALLGHVYHDRQHLREKGFTLYYAAVNIGVFLAMFTLGYLGQKDLWGCAFTIAAVIQIVGLIPFLKVMKSPILSKLHLIQQQRGLFEQPKQTPLSTQEKDRLKVITILAVFSILFWITYNQGGSSMTLFALGYTDRNLLGFEIPPAWLFSAEPLYLVL
jgi:POT family proton-dependent oligopeptide transporter